MVYRKSMMSTSCVPLAYTGTPYPYWWRSYSGALRARLEWLGARATWALADEFRRSQYAWEVVPEPGYNACSLGGGAFSFTEALVAELRDQYLLAIIAHEIGHDVLEHAQQRADRLVRTGVISVGLGLVTGEFWLLIGSLVLGGLSDSAEARREEIIADRVAVEILEGLGCGRREIVEVLAWLHARVGDTPGTLFDTHPTLAERMARLLDSEAWLWPAG